jgi:hypothetical protein
MKKFIFFIAFSLSISTLFSQACGNTSLTHIPNVSLHSETGVWVNIYYHIVEKENGTGSNITTSDICNTTRIVNGIFNKYGIFIKQLGVDEIKNNALYNYGGTSTEADALFSKQSRSDAINIYILPSISYPYAKNIPSYAIAAGESDIKNRPALIAHEMGHCFGLYHTHETAFGTEQINGSNGTIAGDKISDTPANPNLIYSVSNCQYTGTFLQNGQPYSPDPRNVMSYTSPNCLDKLSPLHKRNLQYDIW